MCAKLTLKSQHHMNKSRAGALDDCKRAAGPPNQKTVAVEQAAGMVPELSAEPASHAAASAGFDPSPTHSPNSQPRWAQLQSVGEQPSLEHNPLDRETNAPAGSSCLFGDHPSRSQLDTLFRREQAKVR